MVQYLYKTGELSEMIESSIRRYLSDTYPMQHAMTFYTDEIGQRWIIRIKVQTKDETKHWIQEFRYSDLEKATISDINSVIYRVIKNVQRAKNNL